MTAKFVEPRGLANAALVSALIAIGGGLYLICLPSVGSLPNNDYYWVLSQITTKAGVTFSPAHWASLKSNEHTVLVPAIGYVLNIWLTGGDNRVLSAAAVSMLALTFVTLFRWLFAGGWASTSARAVLGLAVALIVFAPTTAHNVVMGFSGSIWLTANAFSVGAIAGLDGRGRGGPLWPVVLLGLAAGLSYSTGLFVWPVLVLGAWLLRTPRRDLVALAIAAAAIIGYSVAFYAPVPGHPAPETSPAVLANYVGGYLGSVLTFDPILGSVFGWAGVATSVAVGLVCVRASREASRASVPWLMLQLFALTNGAMAAIFRSGLPEGPGISRYASIPGLFWIGLLATSAISLARRPSTAGKLKPQLALAIMFAVLVALPMYRRGMPTLRYLLDRAAYQPVASEALRLSIHDDEMLGKVTEYPDEVWSVEPFLRSAKHVPFHQTPEFIPPVDAGRLGGASPRVRGYLDLVRRVSDAYGRADGWAYSADGQIVEIALVDESGQTRGRAVIGLPRDDVAEGVARGARMSGWSGYVKLDDSPSTLRAYARTASDWQFHQLVGVQPLPLR